MIGMRRKVENTLEINVFDNYAVHILRPQNTESGKPEKKDIRDKFHDKDDLIILNYIINEI